MNRGSDKLASCPAILLISILFSIFLHVKLGMDGLWDTSNYHFYIGWAASKLMHYEFGAVAQFHTYLNPIIDIVNYNAFSIHPYLGATVHSIFFTIATYIVFILAQGFFKKASSVDKKLLFIGVIIGMTGAMSISLFGSWTNENITAVFVLTGLYFLLRGIDSGALFIIFSSGLAFGIAIGLKLTSAHYLIGALFAAAVSTRFNLKIIAGLCTGILIGFLITDGYFMYLRWETVENPIFPFANNVFKSPFYPESWKSFSHFEPSKTLYYLSLPFIWLNSGDLSEAATIRDGRFLLAYIGIGFSVIGFAIHRKISKMEIILIAFFLGSFMAWILAFRVYRYLVALEMITGVLFIIGLSGLLGSRKALVNTFIVIGAMLFLGLITIYPNWGRREWSQNFSKSDLIALIESSEDSIVFFADQRLSYLAPELYEKRVRFANLYSQQWWDGERGRDAVDSDKSVDTTSIPLSKFNKIYFLQYSKLDPRSKSAYLGTLFSGKYYDCQLVTTNMGSNPLLCSFKDFADMALVEPSVTYHHDSKNILFLDGWSHKEAQHRWTDGEKSSIVMNINKTGTCIPFIELNGWVLGEQNIKALVNGSVAFEGKVSGDVTLKLHGKANTNSHNNIVKVDLVLPDAHPPSNGHSQKLGFALQSLKLDCGQTS